MIGILIGTALSIWVTLVFLRYQRFSEAKEELVVVVQSLESTNVGTIGWRTSLTTISGKFYRMGQPLAGHTANDIFKQLASLQLPCSYCDFSPVYERVQQLAMHVTPIYHQLFFGKWAMWEMLDDLYVLRFFTPERAFKGPFYQAFFAWVTAWFCIMMNVPEFWNRVHGTIHEYQTKNTSGPFFTTITHEETRQRLYNRAVMISKKFQIASQFIQPTFFATIFWLVYDIILPHAFR